MVSFLRMPLAYFLTFVLLLPTSIVYGQQSSLQMSLMSPAPASVALSSLGISPAIAQMNNGSYLSEVSKPGFQPTPSDLLVQRAEQRFRDGKNAYKAEDPNLARAEFDEAIDLMLK